MRNEAPGRHEPEAARDEGRAATAEREAQEPAAERPAVAGVSWRDEWLRPYRRAWVPPA